MQIIYSLNMPVQLQTTVSVMFSVLFQSNKDSVELK